MAGPGQTKGPQVRSPMVRLGGNRTATSQGYARGRKALSFGFPAGTILDYWLALHGRTRELFTCLDIVHLLCPASGTDGIGNRERGYSTTGSANRQPGHTRDTAIMQIDVQFLFRRTLFPSSPGGKGRVGDGMGVIGPILGFSRSCPWLLSLVSLASLARVLGFSRSCPGLFSPLSPANRGSVCLRSSRTRRLI